MINLSLKTQLYPFYNLNPRYVQGGWGVAFPKVFLSFLLGDKTSAPDVFSSFSLILRVHFESSSVMVRFYGYEI